MKWLLLTAAIMFEVTGTIMMKLSEGFTNIKYSVFMLVFYVLSLGTLTLALKKIQIATAYATWSGVGIALLTIIGYIFFGDQLSALKIIFISLIIIGVVGLNLLSDLH